MSVTYKLIPVPRAEIFTFQAIDSRVYERKR